MTKNESLKEDENLERDRKCKVWLDISLLTAVLFASTFMDGMFRFLDGYNGKKEH